MRANLSLSAVALAALLSACARPHVQSDLGPLVTDRPDFTESVETIAPGYTQVEGGVTLSHEDGVHSSSNGEALIRAGLSRRMELRVVAPNYATERAGFARAEGLEDAGLGVKIGLHQGPEGPSAEPTISIIAATSLPTGSQVFRSRRALPEVKLLGAWTLSERVGFASNLNWARTDASTDEWAASGSFGFSLTDKVGAYTEAYSFAENVGGWETRNYLNAGLTYLFNDAFQVDARVGTRVGGDTHGTFFGLGVSRRF